MDQVSKDRLAQCHPALQKKVIAAIAACEAHGVYVRITSGLRTYAEQDALFFSCHHPDGTVDKSKPWKTNARGGYSNHNFGMAVDVCPSLHGSNVAFNPCWDEKNAVFTTMVREMKAQGLAWGGEWTKRDPDHFQLADVEVTPTAQNRAMFAKGGMQAVWASYQDDSQASKVIAV